MIWLILSILCSVVLVFIFRLFPSYGVHTFQAIVYNYIVATLMGLFIQRNELGLNTEGPWLPFAIVLGIIFITLFFLIALTAQKSGITIATVSMKLGMVAPVAIGILLFDESSSGLKIAGVLFAIAAVVLTSWKREPEIYKKSHKNKLLVFLPFIVFAGSGVSDSIVQYTERSYFATGGFESFIIILFGTAGLIGLIIILPQYLIGKQVFNVRNLIAGIILGVPNYGSIYFLYKTLNLSSLESSIIFPVNNIGIVSAASLGALIFFRERLNIYNILGLASTLIAIILISLS